MADFRAAIPVPGGRIESLQWRRPGIPANRQKWRTLAMARDDSSRKKNEFPLILDANLSSRMAAFQCALSSTAENNEMTHCRRNFTSSIQSLVQHSDSAQRHCQAFQASLDSIEARLALAPSASEISSLQTRLERASSSLLPQSGIEQLIREAELLESRLAEIPSAEEIQALDTRIPEMLMKRSWERVGDGARRLRRAMDRAEIAWLRHLEDAASQLIGNKS
ncbi:uncharacterized protein LOC9660618 isoform X1 [Selaginella moellendorffii]|uniref:uncharacterized protein LOC9660618 isoform X1 n=1 Tax=Selaginella moellendorffii TaxID=88036 RepID=UPI000D1CA10C|nr:uncharacterized protein LOC9660618 isoform X1 [Selaginella moellendorffii]|eukprot:XP_024530070.1 uncharacterized protein LOC9660618 isoform X1 [Selaginella moellendorffii]